MAWAPWMGGGVGTAVVSAQLIASGRGCIRPRVLSLSAHATMTVEAD
jgi:hypothetical protein